jgi:hypothetical protein
MNEENQGVARSSAGRSAALRVEPATQSPAKPAATNAGALIALAERCEQAEGPSRALDGAIAAAIEHWPASAYSRESFKGGVTFRFEANEEDGSVRIYSTFEGKEQGIHRYRPERYTASLDAAMTLVPEGWGGGVNFSENRRHNLASLGRSYPTNATVFGQSATLALALTAAALRALAAQGIEAATAGETGSEADGLDPKDESPVAERGSRDEEQGYGRVRFAETGSRLRSSPYGS